MAAGGRKSKYNDEILERVKAYARDGLTEKEMCAKLRISQSTFTEWKTKFPALSAALKESKEVVDNLVVGALLKRALGFEYDEIHEIDAPEGHTSKTIRKMVVPDTTAQIFWLKNRRPDLWRENKDTGAPDGSAKELFDMLRKSRELAEEPPKEPEAKK